MSFDTLAPHYHWMEWLLAGNKLQRCRTASLDSIPSPHQVLIYGEGNGRFLTELCRRFPAARVTCVDASARMIELARRRLTRNSLSGAQVEFIHADALMWTPPANCFDLVVTHFFLDCFRQDQLAQLMPLIASAAAPRANWLIADFKVAETGLRRWRSQAILAIMYVFFRHVTRLPARELTAPEGYMEGCGFRRVRRVESNFGLLHSDWWQR